MHAGDGFIGGRGDVDPLEGRGEIDFRRRQVRRAGRRQPHRQTEALDPDRGFDCALRPGIVDADCGLDAGERDRAIGRGDQRLRRFAALGEFQSRRGDRPQKVFQLRLVLGQVGAVRREEAPEIEDLARLQSVRAGVERHLVEPAADVDRTAVLPIAATFTPMSSISSLTAVETAPSGLTAGRVVALCGAEIDRLVDRRPMDRDDGLVRARRPAEPPGERRIDQKRQPWNW